MALNLIKLVAILKMCQLRTSKDFPDILNVTVCTTVHHTIGEDTMDLGYMCTQCVSVDMLRYPKVRHIVSKDMLDVGYVCLVWTYWDIPRYLKVQ